MLYRILSLYLAALFNICQFSGVTMQHRTCGEKALTYIIHEKQTKNNQSPSTVLSSFLYFYSSGICFSSFPSLIPSSDSFFYFFFPPSFLFPQNTSQGDRSLFWQKFKSQANPLTITRSVQSLIYSRESQLCVWCCDCGLSSSSITPSRLLVFIAPCEPQTQIVAEASLRFESMRDLMSLNKSCARQMFKRCCEGRSVDCRDILALILETVVWRNPLF